MNVNKPFAIWAGICMLMAGCQKGNMSTVQPEGLWCDGRQHCISFQGEKCMLDNVWFYDYKLNKDSLLLSKYDSLFSTYLIQFDKNILRIKKPIERRWRSFTMQSSINDVEVLTLSYSQASDFAEFSVNIFQSGAFVMNIVYHPVLDSGVYEGILAHNYQAHLTRLIHAMEMNISTKLNWRIISDIQEWALVLTTNKNEKIHLYHNYIDITRKHQNFARFMNYFPLIAKERGGQTNSKKLYFEAKDYMKNEFKRNMKMVKGYETK